jgi:ABC-type polysaccharide/polyol phosphate transport system ATPase subunit
VSDQPAIVVDHVSKQFRLYKDRAGSLKEMITSRNFGRYEEFHALTDVSLSVPEGSVYGLVGHNGSGKSSLLRLIAGIQRPTSGTITTRGRISALLELGAGFHPDLTGRENIYLNAAILGIKRRETDRIIDDIIDFSGLSEFIDSPVRHYSSGMYVRLGFAVAVNVDPQILIVDEVIAVGDEEFQRRCFEHLHKLRGEGVTILFVSHSLDLVRGMCDRAAWLEHGVMRLEGNAGEVVNAYLAEVNDAEAARLTEADAKAAAAADDDPHRPLPPSSRPVSIGDIEFLGADGQTVPVVRTHDPVTIRIHYHCHRPVMHPLLSLSVENEGSVYVANPGMRKVDRPAVEVTGDHYVDYHIDRLMLAAGLYRLSVAAHASDAAKTFDKVADARTLRVQPADWPVHGMVDLGGQWDAASVASTTPDLLATPPVTP